MITQTLDLLSHALMFREHTCYCQVCACKEFAKGLAENCKLKCPVCQREANRIVVKDAADDERVPTLRRCKSATTVREKLEEEIVGIHRSVVPVQRESSSQDVAEDEQKTQRELAECRHNETMSAIKKLQDGPVVVQKSEVSSQQEPPNQVVAETKQNTQRSFTLRTYVEALSAFRKLVDAISDCCGAEVQLQQEPSSQTAEEGKQNAQENSVTGLCEETKSALEKTAEESSQTVEEGTQTAQEDSVTGLCEETKSALEKTAEESSQTAEEGKQNTKTYSVMGLCEEAMSALEETAKELLGKCDAEIPGHQESTSWTDAGGSENSQRGDLAKLTYERTESAFGKLHETISASTAVETPTPVQQTPSDQIVVEETWSVRRGPLLHRCESATFSWDKKCPFCQMTPDVYRESKCVSSCLTNCVVL